MSILRQIFASTQPTDVEAAQRQQQLAQAMQVKALQGTETAPQYYTGKTALADLASSLVAAYNVKRANENLQNAKDAQSARTAIALKNYQASVPDNQVAPELMNRIQATAPDELPEPVESRSDATQGLIDSMPPDQKQQMIQALVAQQMVPKATQNSTRIGAYQPGDYTPESFATFEKSGNAADLVRYAPPQRIAAPKTAPKANGFDDPRIQALQASMVAAGYSPPAGFRSKEQQLSMFQGLLKKYDGLSTDDIAHLAASNAIDYKSVGKATQAAAGMGGKIELANNELAGFVPIAKDASAAVDRGSFVPFSKLKQKGQASISDPNLKRLFVATQTVLNAYDVLAARGGTDKDKRAENHRILETADSPEAYNAALDMIVKEGAVAGEASRKTMRADSFGYPTGQPAATKELTYDPATGTFK